MREVRAKRQRDALERSMMGVRDGEFGEGFNLPLLLYVGGDRVGAIPEMLPTRRVVVPKTLIKC